MTNSRTAAVIKYRSTADVNSDLCLSNLDEFLSDKANLSTQLQLAWEFRHYVEIMALYGNYVGIMACSQPTEMKLNQGIWQPGNISTPGWTVPGCLQLILPHQIFIRKVKINKFTPLFGAGIFKPIWHEVGHCKVGHFQRHGAKPVFRLQLEPGTELNDCMDPFHLEMICDSALV